VRAAAPVYQSKRGGKGGEQNAHTTSQQRHASLPSPHSRVHSQHLHTHTKAKQEANTDRHTDNTQIGTKTGTDTEAALASISVSCTSLRRHRDRDSGCSRRRGGRTSQAQRQRLGPPLTDTALCRAGRRRCLSRRTPALARAHPCTSRQRRPCTSLKRRPCMRLERRIFADRRP
jgi:hypothetical protein